MFGLSLNTMSIGGLVVALGVVVDDAVIDVENITRRRRNAGAAGAELDARELFVGASLEVRLPVFYATAAVAVALLPIFMLTGIQGTFFRPLSLAFLLAVGISLVVAMSATPALCAVLMRKHKPPEEARFLLACKRFQRRTIEKLYRHPRVVLAAGARHRARRRAAAAAVRPAAAAGFPRELSDRPCQPAPGRLAAGDHPGRRADLQAAGGDSRHCERRRADRPRREWSGPGCAERERVRYPDQSRQGLHAGSDRGGRSTRCSTTSPTSSRRSTRCWPSASARRCPARRRRSSSVYSAMTWIPMMRSRRRSPRCCRSCRTPARCACEVPPRAARAVCATAAAAAGAVRTAAGRRAAGCQCGLPRHRRRRELAQADRSIPVAVRIAGAGASPQAVGALLLRSPGGRRGAAVGGRAGSRCSQAAA